jgi:Predicted dehydrogenases and related proteins
MGADGMNYAPAGKPKPVVKAGEFFFGAMYLDHGHINGMCNGLTEAGAVLKYVYDTDRERGEAFASRYPGAVFVDSEEVILKDPSISLVAAAAITSKRCEVGLRCMDAGKDYFTDKAPFTTLEQLESAITKVKETGKKYMVYYSERLHVESAIYAGNLVKSGAIGKVINVMGLGPHRIGNPATRPDWFFEKESYGGILCDIGSHQIEQYLYYADVKAAEVTYSRVANYNHPEYPGLEDFGDAMVTGDNGATNYFRVDWFTPDGLSSWGDGRTVILGTEGYIELRKYVNIGVEDNSGDNLIIVDKTGEHFIKCKDTVGYPFFGELILDCINRTENAMTQEHAFLAARLCLECELKAEKIS